jgi:hypothetical protein
MNALEFTPMSDERTGIVRYGETSSPIEDSMERSRRASHPLSDLLDSKAQPVASGIPGFISEQEFADQLGLALATIRRWRRTGYGPKFVKIGRRDFCKENAATEFAAEQLAKAEAAAEPRRRGRPRSTT